MTKKNKQHRTVINIMIAVYTIGLLLFLLLALNSCNPVKQVLRDEYKMRKVWNEGALQGWCVNDSIIINKSDTLITFDTLYVESNFNKVIGYNNEMPKKVDSIYGIWEGNPVVKYVTKTIRITDTITNIVTDNSRIYLLQKEVSLHVNETRKLKADLVNISNLYSYTKQYLSKWRFRFFLLLTAFGLFLFRKPLWKLATKFISPVKI